jgi:hypothetical protein
MSTLNITHTERMVTETCCQCGVIFAMTESYKASRKKDKEYFYCPNGHAQHYTKSDADHLREELAQERHLREQVEADRTWWKNRSAEKDASLQAKERRLSAAKGQITKIKNRVGKGVCPCCNRFFSDLNRHMTSKHPTYAAAEPQS